MKQQERGRRADLVRDTAIAFAGGKPATEHIKNLERN